MENKKRNGIFHNITIVLLLLLFLQLAPAVGRFIASIFTYDKRVEYGIFTWISIHHIVQMILAIIVIVIIAKVFRLNFGFGLGDIKIGMTHVANFTIVVLVYSLIRHVVIHLLGNISMPNYPLNFNTIAGHIGFQLFLSGPSEEILFRALPMTILLCSFGQSKVILRIKALEISLENMIAALFFTLAHIRFTLNPFSVNASWVQLILSFILGLWYGIAYTKSKSIIYPMAMHSIWNVVVVGARYIHLALLP